MTQPEAQEPRHPDRVHQQDPARTIALPGTAWRATVAVAPDGTETFWLVSPDPAKTEGCAQACCAPHDQDPPVAPRQPQETA